MLLNRVNTVKLLEPKKRFSSRVDNYVKYRPHYPDEIIKYLKDRRILREDSVIADIGSGTGILTELFLNNGNIVYGVEPNHEMRKAGERYLKKHSNFISINGSAEHTNLKKSSIDLITAGQAFHWFELRKTKQEFKRIQKTNGYVVLIWNTKYASTTFLKAYHKLIIKYGTDYEMVKHEAVGKEILSKFYDKGYNMKSFYNKQTLNYKSLKGRLLSSSYIPLPPHPEYKEMIGELKKIFEMSNKNNEVLFEYKTKVFWGKNNFT